MVATQVEKDDASGDRSPIISSKSSSGKNDYICVECLESCSSLYRQYSSPNAVILTRCLNCGQNVDPYVERELLLVIMNLLLLRICAYRHTFHNRTHFGKIPLTSDDSRQIVNCLKLIFCVCMIETYLKYVAFHQYQVILRDNISDSSLSSSYNNRFYSSPSVPHFFLSSLIEYLFMFLGTLFLARIFVINDKLKSPNQFWIKIHNAILLPQCFKFIVMYIHIWEDSPTIRILGSVFVFSYHWMAIHTIIEQQVISQKKKINRKESSIIRMLYGLPILFGIILRTFVPILLRWTIYYNEPIGLKKKHQCASWSIHSSFFQEEICIT